MKISKSKAFSAFGLDRDFGLDREFGIVNISIENIGAVKKFIYRE